MKSAKRFVLFVLFVFSAFAHSEGLKREEQIWSEVLVDIELRKDLDSYQALRSRFLDEHFNNPEIISRFIDFEIKQKNRGNLRSLIVDLGGRNLCQSRRTRICSLLEQWWNDRLLRLSFYESTAPLFEQIRRILSSREDCSSALPVLKQIETQEGVFWDLQEAYIKVYACLGDEQQVALSTEKLQSLRIDFDAI